MDGEEEEEEERLHEFLSRLIADQELIAVYQDMDAWLEYLEGTSLSEESKRVLR
jgi:hypothetical protein